MLMSPSQLTASNAVGETTCFSGTFQDEDVMYGTIVALVSHGNTPEVLVFYFWLQFGLHKSSHHRSAAISPRPGRPRLWLLQGTLLRLPN